MHVTENIGIKIKGRIHDTLVLLKLFNENLPSYALKDLAVRFIDKEANKYEIMKDNWMADHKTGDWTLVPKDLMGDYGCGDVWYTFNLFRKFYKYMEEYEMTQLYDTECALLHTAYGMERVGFKVDRAYLEQAKVEFEKEIAEKQQELYDLNGGIFNANSAQQLYNFFIKLGVDKQDINFTDKGNPCFDKTEKERLAKKYDVVNKLVDLGKLEKLYSSYIINILNTLPATGRIHCSINTCEATTGRMSITDPARRAS
jgi:DNA polymerase-1